MCFKIKPTNSHESQDVKHESKPSANRQNLSFINSKIRFDRQATYDIVE